MWKTFGLCLLLMMTATTALALPVRVDFTVSDFTDIFGLVSVPPTSTPAPNDPLSGSIVWEAASAFDNIEDILSIDLVIDGHVYTPGELAFFQSTASPLRGIGVGAVNAIRAGTSDFLIRWDKDTLAGINFAYASGSTPGGLWDTKRFDTLQFTTLPAVSVPATTLLMIFGLALLLRSRSANS